MFEAHVNKQVTDYVLTRSGRTLRFLPGERREVTILNSDIAGFSTLTQSMDAEELVRFLNEYRGKGIDPGHKSWAFTMIFRGDRTLTGPEVDQAVKNILKSLETSFQAKQR